MKPHETMIDAYHNMAAELIMLKMKYVNTHNELNASQYLESYKVNLKNGIDDFLKFKTKAHMLSSSQIKKIIDNTQV